MGAEADEAVGSTVEVVTMIRYLPCFGEPLLALLLVVVQMGVLAILVSADGAAQVAVADSMAAVPEGLGRKVPANLLTGLYVQYFRALA